MSGQDLSPPVAQFVEDMGLALEALGLSRTAGRTLGYLLVCEPATQTAGELAAALAVSKASVSTTMRVLLQIGLVERLAVRGRRSVHYRIGPGAWRAMVSERLARLRELRALGERAAADLATERGRRDRLQEMNAYLRFVEEEVVPILSHPPAR